MTAVASPIKTYTEIEQEVALYGNATGRGNTRLGNYPTIYKLNRGIPMGVNDVIRANVKISEINTLRTQIVGLMNYYNKFCDSNTTLCEIKVPLCNHLIGQLDNITENMSGGKRKTSKGYTKRSDRKRNRKNTKRNRKNTKRNRKYRSQKA